MSQSGSMASYADGRVGLGWSTKFSGSAAAQLPGLGDHDVDASAVGSFELRAGPNGENPELRRVVTGQVNDSVVRIETVLAIDSIDPASIRAFRRGETSLEGLIAQNSGAALTKVTTYSHDSVDYGLSVDAVVASAGGSYKRITQVRESEAYHQGFSQL